MRLVSRTEYFFCLIMQTVGIIFASYLLDKTGATSVELGSGALISLITLIYVFVMTTRRLRDANLSPYLVIILVIPLIGFLLQIYLLFAKSSSRDEEAHIAQNYSPVSPNNILHQSEIGQKAIGANLNGANKDWENIYREYHSERRDVGLYAKLFAKYEGDEQKILSSYLRERMDEIEKQNYAISQHETMLRDQIISSNFFAIDDGFILGMRDPIRFFVFKNKIFTHSASSIDELINLSPAAKERRLMSLDEKLPILNAHMQLLINSVKSKKTD